MKNYSDFGIYDFSDYAEELTGEALIRVNGGSCGGGFSGGSGTGGSGGGSSGGNSGGAGSGAGTSSGGNRGGSSGGSGGGTSSGSGSCGGGGSSSASSPASGHSGTSGTSTTGSQTGGTTSTTSSDSSCGGSSGRTSGSTTSGKTNIGTGGTSSGYGACGGGVSSVNNAINKINNSINENSDKKYNENGNGYRCDNWVEEVLTDAGYDSGRYLTAGKASEKTVQDHINALESSGNKYSKTIPTKEGVYVVFMNGTGSLGTLDPHCGILNVSASGAMTFTHNSSANANKGIESLSVVSQNNGTKLSQLAYSSFYFQEIK